MNFSASYKYIFSDFDGTISKRDAVHSFITRFAKGDWSHAEKSWMQGEISTAKCIEIEMSYISNVKKQDFFAFLDSVELDEAFVEFYNISKKNDKKLIILSDGFDYFINYTLKKYGVSDIEYFSNHLEIIENNNYLNFKVEYPNSDSKCLIHSGCCKCKAALNYTDDFVYIGDGLSDRCIAKRARVLFAKKSLETFCKNEKISYFPCKTFQDVTDILYKENLYAPNCAKGRINRE